MIEESLIRAQLTQTLDDTDFPELGAKYEGKVRDCYTRERAPHHRRHRPPERVRRRAGHDSRSRARC